MGDYKNPRGDTFTLKLVVTILPDGSSVPVPVDITGWIFWFSVKRYVSDPDNKSVYQAKTGDSSGSVTITDAPNGKLTVVMPSLATREFPDGPVPLVYDVQSKDVQGNVTTIDSGTVTISPDVTRTTT